MAIPILLAIALLLAMPAAAIDWPQEIDAPEGTIVVYQPQPESLDGNVLKARAAMQLELKNGNDPIFGAFWFTAQIDTDRDAGTVLVRDIHVTDVRWPDSKDPDEQRFNQAVEQAVPDAGFTVSLERFTSSLASAEASQKSLADLKHDPPEIVFREDLSVLLLYDGKPRFVAIEKSPYERAQNTPLAVVRDTRSKECFLTSGNLWYEASDPLGPWKPTTKPPADLVSMLPKPDGDAPVPKTPPEIVVATEPTEVISTDGPPEWTSLDGGELLYVSNTETPYLRHLATGNLYVLLSGRWYRAKGSDGPWEFVRADALPDSFANIPPASDIGGLRTSVAGTDEAQDAVLDAQVPQTAAIDRSGAKLEVTYDGKPKFEKIPGTKVSYAVNTASQVLEIEGRYYAVDDGVWFTAKAATGPWQVADEVPSEEIAKIPPSAPVYNVTHVHIYDATPEVVYVGYTPGYVWSYPYYGVPVYGTGWYYPPYWGAVYYPRPPTWGLHVGYNPWTGWNYGVSWSAGFMTFGVSFGGGYRCCGGWYGGGYRHNTIINTGDINIGNTINVGNHTNIGNRIDRDTKIGGGNRNLYQQGKNSGRLADAKKARRPANTARPSRERANDVFADRSGNVARKTGDQWKVRDQGDWRDAASGTRDHERVSHDRPHRSIDRPDLDRDRMARQRGGMRERSRPVPRGGMGGGMRGGGGRLRR